MAPPDRGDGNGRSWLDKAIALAQPPVSLADNAPGLSSGIGWNLLGFVTIALAGLLLNIAVAGFYDATTLGYFNIILSVYIVGGQLAAFGIQYSTLYHVSVLADEPEEAASAIQAALLAVAVISALVCALIWLGNAAFTGNPALASAMVYALPGLFLFPLNKTMLAALNGGRRMGLFALFNAGRVAIVVVAVVLAGIAGVLGESLSGCLSIAEGLLFLGLVVANRAAFRTAAKASRLRSWLRRHLQFGSRGMLGGLIAEANSRIDVLVLGLFASSSAVGVYSVGAMFAEGLLQLVMVLRVNLDPVLARLIAEKHLADLRRLIDWAKRLGYVAMTVAGLGAILAYPVIVPILFDWSTYADSWLVFAILTCGIMLSAGFVPFGGLLQQSRNPLSQTAFSATMASLNLLGNLLLAPFFGMIGSALGTALAQSTFPLVLNRFAKARLNLTI